MRPNWIQICINWGLVVSELQPLPNEHAVVDRRLVDQREPIRRILIGNE
jgi:hypothetical protein